MRPPFPLVVGCPRSGTTLVRSFLDSHPDMAIPGESDVTVPLLLAARGPDRLLPRRRAAEILADSHRTAAWGIDLAAVLASVPETSGRGGPEVSAAALVRALHDAYADAHGRPRGGDKTPFHARRVDLLTAALPESVVVHVLRDPRAVAAAMRSVSWATDDPHEAGRAWTRHVGSARAISAQVGPDRYVEVRYEELVADPWPILERLCAVLHLEPAPEMLDRGASAARARAQTEHSGDHANLDRPLTRTRDWRVELSALDRRRVEAVAGDLMVSCGYLPEHDPLSAGQSGVRAVDSLRFAAVAAARPRLRRLRQLAIRPSSGRPQPRRR